MTAHINFSRMSDDQVIEECRAELNAARAISGGGAFLRLGDFSGEGIMRLIVKQADRIKELEDQTK